MSLLNPVPHPHTPFFKFTLVPMDNKENSMKKEGENREAYGWRDKKKWL
jgi:hypothetical protein